MEGIIDIYKQYRGKSERDEQDEFPMKPQEKRDLGIILEM